MDDLDSAMDVVNAFEERNRRNSKPQESSRGRTQVGSVEQYFEKISVAAIKLTGALKVGDLIEIGSEDEAIRQRISSMQIDREDVGEAQEDESIGIKVNHPVAEGSAVYRLDS